MSTESILREWGNKPQAKRRYLQKVYLIMDYCSKYTTNSYSTIRNQTTWLRNMSQDLTDTSPRKIQRCQLKDVPHHMSSGNCKLKQQWNTILYLLESSTSWTLTTPTLARTWSNRSSRSLLGGVQHDMSTLEDSWVVSYKTKPTLTIWSCKC